MEKKRILVIDDEATFAWLLKLNLEQRGPYEVTTAHRGLQGLEAAKRSRPDLVLLDMIMPDLDGADVAERFEADADLRDVPIVFITAMVSKGEVMTDAAGRVGRHPYISKPVSMEEILSCIEEQLGRA